MRKRERQLLTESILLATVSGGLGVLFALWIKDSLLAAGDWTFGNSAALNPRLDWRVLGFTLGLALLTGVVFGIVPALRATRYKGAFSVGWLLRTPWTPVCGIPAFCWC